MSKIMRKIAAQALAVMIASMTLLVPMMAYGSDADASPPSPLATSPVVVTDGTMADWNAVPTQFYDSWTDSATGSGSDLTQVGFSNNDPYMFIRWDVVNDNKWKAGILYDIGFDRAGDSVPPTNGNWDVYCAAQIESGVLTQIYVATVSGSQELRIWNATDAGGVLSDYGRLYQDPVPGGVAVTRAVEAKFPLAVLQLQSSTVLGRFRSHAALSVSSAIKDYCPDQLTGYVRYNTTTGIGGFVNGPGQPMPAAFAFSEIGAPNPVQIGAQVSWQVNFHNLGESASQVAWVNITLPAKTAYVGDDSAAMAAAFGGTATHSAAGQMHMYTFTSIPPGNHHFHIVSTVLGTATPGESLTSTGNLDFRENLGPDKPCSATVTVASASSPNAPSGPSPTDGSSGAGSSVNLGVTVSDPNGDPMDVSFYDEFSNLIGVDYGVPSGGTAAVDWTGLDGHTTYTWYVTADDGTGNTTSVQWTFTTANNPPVTNAGTDQGGVADFNCQFDGSGTNEADGDSLNYTWTFTYEGDIVTLYGPNPAFIFEMPGRYNVTLTVDDGWGGVTADSVVITVSAATHDIVYGAPGWKLLSVAVGCDGGRAPADLFADEWANIEFVQYLDAVSGDWKVYARGAPAWTNDLKLIDETMAVWVKFTGGDGTLSVQGKALTATTIQLRTGWNLVGCPDQDSVSANTVLAGTGYDGLQRFNPAGLYLIYDMPGTDPMLPGEGYWVHVPADASYSVTY